MTIYYNAQDRKPLVKAISEFTGADAVYMRTPTYAYRIDYFTVTREGNLEFDDRADSEEIEGLLEFLAERGFIAEVADTSNTEPTETASEELPAVADSAAHSETVGLMVEVPLDSTAVENLTKLLDAKGRLIRRALAVDSLPIEVTDSAVKFPWFSECDAYERKAYTHFRFRALRTCRQCQTGHSKGKGNRQRQVRFPLLSAAIGIHRLGIQGRTKNSVEKPHRLIGI